MGGPEAEYGPRRRYAGEYDGAGREYARGGAPDYRGEPGLYGGRFSGGGGMWRRSGAAGGDYRETSGRGEGVGRYRGRGPKGYRRSDERIREDVCDRLTDDEDIDASEIEVTVESGVVTLNGSVDSREAKRRAEDVAETVTGVREVQNHLRLHGRQSSPLGEHQTEQRSAVFGGAQPSGGEGSAGSVQQAGGGSGSTQGSGSAQPISSSSAEGAGRREAPPSGSSQR
jgi:hypothetical protein